MKLIFQRESFSRNNKSYNVKRLPGREASGSLWVPHLQRILQLQPYAVYWVTSSPSLRNKVPPSAGISTMDFCQPWSNSCRHAKVQTTRLVDHLTMPGCRGFKGPVPPPLWMNRLSKFSGNYRVGVSVGKIHALTTIRKDPNFIKERLGVYHIGQGMSNLGWVCWKASGKTHLEALWNSAWFGVNVGSVSGKIGD